MADAPLDIILDMISLLLQNTLNTLSSIFGLLMQLLGSLSAVSGTGTLGIFLAFAVLAVVGIFLAKFFIGFPKGWQKLFKLCLGHARQGFPLPIIPNILNCWSHLVAFLATFINCYTLLSKTHHDLIIKIQGFSSSSY